MSILISAATGNWLTAATWGLVNGTSYLNSESNSTTLSTTEATNRAASGTTPGAIKLRAHRAYVTLRQRISGRGTDKAAPSAPAVTRR